MVGTTTPPAPICGQFPDGQSLTADVGCERCLVVPISQPPWQHREEVYRHLPGHFLNIMMQSCQNGCVRHLSETLVWISNGLQIPSWSGTGREMNDGQMHVLTECSYCSFPAATALLWSVMNLDRYNTALSP